MRILTIDDDDVDRLVLRQLLMHNFPASDVIEADGAAQALPLMRAHLPSLVLLELEMPRGHGYALFKTIRATWPRVPVVLMTEARPGGTLPIRQLGAAGSLAKSEARERLAGVVRNALRLAETDRSSAGHRVR